MPWLLPDRPAHAAVEADEARLGSLSVRAASVVGVGHRCDEPATPRQDAYRIGRDKNGRYLVVAVADGVSGCRFSELGADAAVDAAVGLLCDALESADPRRPDGSVLESLSPRRLFEDVAAYMERDAAGHQVRPQDVGAVLIVAVIPAHCDAAGSRPLWVSWLGDVSAWSLVGGEWQAFAGDMKGRGNGGLVSNDIVALLPSDPSKVEGGQVMEWSRGGVIALVTDGVGDALVAIPEANRAFAARWSTPPAFLSFVNDVNFDAPTYQDDRTAVVVWADR